MMIHSNALQYVLDQYGVTAEPDQITPFGTGLINCTWKVNSITGKYLLQRINTNVFKSPERIDHNLSLIKTYLSESNPEYIFAGPTVTLDGRISVAHNNEVYRVQPFISGSYTLDSVTSAGQAYQAAKQFAKFSRLLKDLKTDNFAYPLENFHNLDLRVAQFNKALENAQEKRITLASSEIHQVKNYMDIAFRYNQIVDEKLIPLRIIHHDTKISNVLFDHNDNGLCVIDLDTVMPGFFISDVGDMMRTYLSEATEEEQDFDRITVRKEVFNQICRGYLEEMGEEMTAVERELFLYSGRFMIYMQAVRFLTDFLNGDVYYPIKYPLHNLKRAGNQIKLLQRYMDLESEFI